MAVKKMFIRIFIVLFLFLISCQKKPSSTDIIQSFKGTIPDTLSVMEYNVENLFDMVDNGTEYPEYKPGAFNWTLSTYQAKLDNIASAIAALHPDIGVLVEIENENALKALLAVLKEKHCAYPYYALGDTPNHTATMPVVFSRFPLFNTRGYGVLVKGGAEASRNLLETSVYLITDTLALFACHWPSKKEPESSRLVAAEVLKNRLLQLSPACRYLIAGDFNENYDESASFHTLGSDDTRGKTGVNHVLGTLRSANGCFSAYVTKKNISRGPRPRHFDPWLDIDEDKRMSEMFRHQKNTPDHFLVPPTLLDTSKLSYADRSFRVFTWDGRLLFNGEPYRWRMRFENKEKYHRGEGYSDHLPILLKLTQGPFHPDDTGSDRPAGKKATINGTIGFETGYEGWVSGAAHIKLRRDTTRVRRGTYCLKIVGEAGKQNGCAARAIVPCVLKTAPSNRCLLMRFRGRGTLSLRIRASKTGKWTYYNGSEFKPAKAAKYAGYDFPEWTRLRLPILSDAIPLKEIQAEIRVKKESLIEVWIDDISIADDVPAATPDSASAPAL